MTGVIIGMKTDQVGAQETLQDLDTRRQKTEQLERRERDMEKEPDLRIGQLLLDQPRQQHQLVVVDPDCRIRLGDALEDIEETPIDRLVRGPRLVAVFHVGREVVKERPDGVVAEAAVVEVELLLAQIDRFARVLGT